MLEHGILRAPQDLSLLSEYIQLARSVLTQRSLDEQIERLEALESFVLSRLAEAPLHAAEAIIKHCDELRALRETAIAAASSSGGAAFDESDPLWQRACADDLTIEPPADPEMLGDHRRALEALVEGLPERLSGERATSRLESALEHARLAEAFEATAAEVSSLMARAKSAEAVLSGYALQQAEALLRPQCIEAERLDLSRRRRLTGLLEALRTESESVAQKVRESDAEERWAAITRGPAPFPMPSSSEPAQPDGTCQRFLRQQRQMMQQLQEILPSLAGTKAARAATLLISETNDAAARCLATQQRQYDRWALAKIREGHAAANKFRGIIDDEKKLGAALIEHFGPIDQRLLTPEAQRCYSEVFELLFDDLNRPGKPTDFDDEKNKLYVLSRMMEATKYSPSDF